jgi:hypothetical protein
MSYEYNIHYFYKGILKTIIEELERYSQGDKELQYLELLKELKFDLNIIDIKTNIGIITKVDIETNLGIITNGIMSQILELIDRNYYEIYFKYADRKLKDTFNEKLNIEYNYPNSWTNYNLDDLAKEPDDKFNKIMEKLDVNIINTNLTDSINGVKDLVDLCSLEFPRFDKNINTILNDLFSKSDIEEYKNRLIEAFYSVNPNKDNKNLHKIISKYIDFLIELRSTYQISHNDVDNITKRLFRQRKILEIITFRLITRAGFPSVLNIKLNIESGENEIDIITLIDKPNHDGSGIRLIEVTTRKDYLDKLDKSLKLLDKLRKEGIDKIKMIIVTFEDITDKKDDVKEMHIISFYELIKDYPYKLISTLYY